MSAENIKARIMEGTRIGATPVTHGVALPHFRSAKIEHAEMALIRARQGVCMTMYNPLTHEEEGEACVEALFFLVSPESDPAQHLRMLARIAERVDEESFSSAWHQAADEQQLRQCLQHDDRFLTLNLTAEGPTRSLLDKPLSTVDMPKGCLVAMLHREGHSFVPNGKTVLKSGDRLTIIGDIAGLAELKATYWTKQE